MKLDGATLDLVGQRFRALGEPQRLRILSVLQSGPKSVNEIVERLNVVQSTVSRHLQALFAAGLLERRRDGAHVVYSVADPNIYRLCELVCNNVTAEARVKLAALAGAPVGERRKRG
jgi:ArsR family transcriptional regulator